MLAPAKPINCPLASCLAWSACPTKKFTNCSDSELSLFRLPPSAPVTTPSTDTINRFDLYLRATSVLDSVFSHSPARNVAMPLDTSTYSMALLRVDGRRWNELRRLHAQIRTQSASDGSSYLEMGHTKVLCVVTGPTEKLASQRMASSSSSSLLDVNISIAGFSSVDRKRPSRTDKRVSEMAFTVQQSLNKAVHAAIFPNSTISISLTVLSQDGSLLASLFNAATLALVDAGIPMSDYVTACTSGSTSSYAAADDAADPLLDLNRQEEQELPFLTVATLGGSDRVCALVCESRVQVSRLEGMLAVGVDGCKQVRTLLDRVIRERGAKMIEEGAIARGDVVGAGDEMDTEED
ncbi:hypothetical protein MKZ38_004482 [Zalerion maritima]|uniref:Ribosomal RNA-processing protein 41 n=1 Tax=Zalerion maritima TaxID=339359 RepID=A0AAD5WPW0_9PEZI|nr:hypothetical protein MKZ38_004482 [Zalerion maritima]